MENNENVKENINENTKEDSEKNTTESTAENPDKKEAKHHHHGLAWFLHLLQPACLTAALLMLVYLLMNSVIFLEDEYGNTRVYSLWNETNTTTFEDSPLFRDLLRERVNSVVEVGALRQQIETYGQLDGNKTFDINAFANRRTDSSDGQLAVEYRLNDLISWAEQGFEYQRVYQSAAEWEGFWVQTDSGAVEVEPIVVMYKEYVMSNVEIIDVGRDVSLVTYIKKDYLDDYLSRNKHLNEYVDVEAFARRGFFFEDIYWDDSEKVMMAYMGDGFWLSLNEAVRLYDLSIEMLSVEQEKQLIQQEQEAQQQQQAGQQVQGNFYDMLINRFQTVAGKNLEEYAANYGEYRLLANNLVQTAVDLRQNYERYQEASRYYESNSNLYYLIRTKNNGPYPVYLHNLPLESVQDQDVYTAFRALTDKYLYYNTGDWSYETNTSIEGNYVRGVLRGFAEDYPDGAELWIGVNTAYPLPDIFAQASTGYRTFSPYLESNIIIIVVCLSLFVVLIFVLSVLTGRAVDENGIRTTRLWSFDHIFTEIWLALAAVFFGVLLVVGLETANNTNMLKWLVYSRPNLFLALFGIGVFVVGLIFSLFFYSFVRRIKAKSWWGDSLLVRLWRLIVWAGRLVWHFMVFLAGRVKAAATFLAGRVRDAATFLYENTGLIGRFALPVGGVLLAHLILLALMIAAGSWWEFQLFIMLLVLAIDAAAVAVLLRSVRARAAIMAGVDKICGGDLGHKIEETGLYGDNLALAQAINQIGDTVSDAVETSRRDERMKAELITNVSHDLKTPLTSIINYIDLIKRENVADETIRNYVAILDDKAQRLKQLSDDLLEISKISSGNITLQMEKINLTELVNQMMGEFADKYAERNLHFHVRADAENLCIKADSRHIWRVVENLGINIHKYAMPGTRVYVDIAKREGGQVALEIKNISEQALDFSVEELTERFVRGDASRGTEGSGLGLSIAGSLTEAQGGGFAIQLDGDLFKVILTFPLLLSQ